MEDKEKKKKAENSSKNDRVTLKKEIGLLSACAIIIGNIIGSGIFISPKGVLEHAGSVGLSLIVWVCGGGICALGSLCYAELGVTIPKSGGDYSYVTEIFGGLVGFLLLWSAVLIMYPTTLAVIALTFSNYVLQPAFQNCLPPFIATRLLATICILVTVTLLSLSTMGTGNGQDTLHINDGGSYWPGKILVGRLMFLLIGCLVLALRPSLWSTASHFRPAVTVRLWSSAVTVSKLQSLSLKRYQWGKCLVQQHADNRWRRYSSEPYKNLAL